MLRVNFLVEDGKFIAGNWQLFTVSLEVIVFLGDGGALY